MADRPILELVLGERVTLRKQHPCGGRAWQVVRLGADIGLTCERCGRRVLLERRDVERRLVAREPAAVPRDPPAPADAGALPQKGEP